MWLEGEFVGRVGGTGGDSVDARERGLVAGWGIRKMLERELVAGWAIPQVFVRRR